MQVYRVAGIIALKMYKTLGRNNSELLKAMTEMAYKDLIERGIHMMELDMKEIAKQLSKKDREDISAHLRRMAQEYKAKESGKKEKDD